MTTEQTTAFATAALMEQRTGGEITADDYPFLDEELAAATEDIRAFCRWHVAPVQSVAYRRALPYPDDVWLPAMRIASIDEVTVDGVAWTPEQVQAVEFDPDTGWTNLYGRTVVVQFTAGFEKTPASIVSATLELAATALGTALGQTREQAGGVSLQYARVGGGIDEDTPGGRRLLAYRIGRLP